MPLARRVIYDRTLSVCVEPSNGTSALSNTVSPSQGLLILITSAPNSARVRTAVGPGQHLRRIHDSHPLQRGSETTGGHRVTAERQERGGRWAVVGVQAYCRAWLQHPAVLRVVSGHDNASVLRVLRRQPFGAGLPSSPLQLLPTGRPEALETGKPVRPQRNPS